ncbi:malonate decarboxylase acyl carrier protein [Saccharopolyspora sp. K220]|uniref:malonate decarboxylase acyl carrier protein n=1 Tax=Saccharopolyspora soli TaxID=2926618 RepID=UPI001F577804|nr:malonate decarboxylase acyl carrier protein [Saccharopolyspora soli]MCI2421915.1 malonate decarboxylase acyl carrier protein [Saccharopolyspora soli]
MQILTYRFPADRVPLRRVHVGVVASGDLEILLDLPAPETEPGGQAEVRVRTSIDGFEVLWQAVLERFFARTSLLGRWELNDFGATPGVVALRLRQAAESATRTDNATGGEPA